MGETNGAVTEVTTVVEIRAKHDRNRLLGTFDPVRGVLRLFHRGQIVVVNLPAMAPELPALGEFYAE